MGLIEDHQVPLGLLDTGENVILYRKVNGGDNAVVLDPDVLAEASRDGLAGDQRKRLPESLPHLPPPLVGQRLGAQDQHPRHLSALHQLAHEQPRHDGFASARVVREQEADAGQWQDAPVHRIELMQQRVNL